MTTIHFVNLTKHHVNVVRNDGKIETIEPSGMVARVKADQTHQMNVNGFDVLQTEWGTVSGIPSPKDDTFLITSSLVAMALPDRKDIITPNTHPRSAVRDADGNIVAVTSFQAFWRTRGEA